MPCMHSPLSAQKALCQASSRRYKLISWQCSQKDAGLSGDAQESRSEIYEQWTPLLIKALTERALQIRKRCHY